MGSTEHFAFGQRHLHRVAGRPAARRTRCRAPSRADCRPPPRTAGLDSSRPGTKPGRRAERTLRCSGVKRTSIRLLVFNTTDEPSDNVMLDRSPTAVRNAPAFSDVDRMIIAEGNTGLVAEQWSDRVRDCHGNADDGSSRRETEEAQADESRSALHDADSETRASTRAAGKRRPRLLDCFERRLDYADQPLAMHRIRRKCWAESSSSRRVCQSAAAAVRIVLQRFHAHFLQPPRHVFLGTPQMKTHPLDTDLQAGCDLLLFHTFVQTQHKDVAGARRQLEQGSRAPDRATACLVRRAPAKNR